MQIDALPSDGGRTDAARVRQFRAARGAAARPTTSLLNIDVHALRSSGADSWPCGVVWTTDGSRGRTRKPSDNVESELKAVGTTRRRWERAALALSLISASQGCRRSANSHGCGALRIGSNSSRCGASACRQNIDDRAAARRLVLHAASWRAFDDAFAAIPSLRATHALAGRQPEGDGGAAHRGDPSEESVHRFPQRQGTLAALD